MAVHVVCPRPCVYCFFAVFSTQRSTSSSSYTRSNVSCGSQESFAADTVSLPAERSMSTGLVTGRTVSDPSIRLSAVLSGTDETGNTSEVVTQLLQQVVTLKMVSESITNNIL